jgi:hypothetical protein
MINFKDFTGLDKNQVLQIKMKDKTNFYGKILFVGGMQTPTNNIPVIDNIANFEKIIDFEAYKKDTIAYYSLDNGFERFFLSNNDIESIDRIDI